MTLLVGRAPDDRGPGDPALTLGVRLARAWSEDLVLCTVHAAGRAGGPTASPDVPDDVTAVEVTVVDRSVTDGLMRRAREHDATAVVIGDPPVRPGTTSGRLLRAVDRPLAVAGGTRDGGPITRVTCAWSGGTDTGPVLDAAAGYARQAGVALRVAAFAPRPAPTIPPEIGLDAEDEVVAGWREQTLSDQRDALARRDLAGVETLAAVGNDVAAAVASVGWDAGDLLVVGRPAPGPAARLLVGDRTGAVLAAAPVPAVVVPPR